MGLWVDFSEAHWLAPVYIQVLKPFRGWRGSAEPEGEPLCQRPPWPGGGRLLGRPARVHSLPSSCFPRVAASFTFSGERSARRPCGYCVTKYRIADMDSQSSQLSSWFPWLMLQGQGQFLTVLDDSLSQKSSLKDSVPENENNEDRITS